MFHGKKNKGYDANIYSYLEFLNCIYRSRFSDRRSGLGRDQSPALFGHVALQLAVPPSGQEGHCNVPHFTAKCPTVQSNSVHGDFLHTLSPRWDLRGAGTKVRLLMEGRGGGKGAGSAFVDRMRRELGQAGLLGTGVVGEDRVLAGGAGGAAGVRVAGGVLVQGHRQLQVLLVGEGEEEENVSSTSEM